MVFIHFPQHLTEEEEQLQKKYAKLKKKKRALAVLRAPKPEPPPPEVDINSKKRSAEAAANAMEKAKKLLKSGVIKVEAEKKDLSFKRTKRQKEQDKSAVCFTPFSPTHVSGSLGDQDETTEPEKVEMSRPKMKGLYESFVSSREPNHGDEEKKDHEPPKRGNTVYIHGHNITEEMIRRTFLNFGKIVNVNMEKDKNCGFLTFEKMDSADQAIAEMNGSMVGDTQLRVTMARRQPSFDSLSDTSKSSWSAIAASQSQKSSHKDKRELITYDEEDIFN
ncbi:hypothetical protein LSH36_59g00038 [Paralvinella palmiformis]|uniref:Negative elongation factor E n=1 Tax=Paralvinella palmiformis TaxID=53620 RepID=A0AAD9NC10_9ANNE|nr:hypothetical protein LSH36_59g00038 [Paralvinella palmiformis]